MGTYWEENSQVDHGNTAYLGVSRAWLQVFSHSTEITRLGKRSGCYDKQWCQIWYSAAQNSFKIDVLLKWDLRLIQRAAQCFTRVVWAEIQRLDLSYEDLTEVMSSSQLRV